MRSAAAYAPGHVTGFFHIDDTASDPLRRGSLGAGFSIEAGVTTQVSLVEISPTDPLAAPGSQSLRTQICINGASRPDAAVSQEVVDRFLHRLSQGEALPLDARLRASLLSVEHHVRVPESSGFGSSGAAALSLAYALNGLFGQPFSLTECGQIAHLAEITCGTGLGTVIGTFIGGCEIRIQPGAPGIGSVKTFDSGTRSTAVFVVYGPLPTKALLADERVRARVNAAGRRSVERLLERPSVEEFLVLARDFAEGSGLISERVRTTLDLFDAEGIPASMLMFGEGVFTLIERERVPLVRRLVDRSVHDAEVLISRVEAHGGRVVRED